MSERPIAIHRHPQRRTVLARMPDNRQAELYVRGGICWPVLLADGRVEGYAVCAAMEVQSRRVSVVEAERFHSAGAILDESGMILHGGMVGVFNRIGPAWGIDTYYSGQNDGYQKPWILKAIRALIEAKQASPHFVGLEPAGITPVVLYDWTESGRLVVPAGSPVAQAWDVFRAAPGADLSANPLLFAVACALAGIAAYPWRHGG
jgi:hypothetical protein